ncbi:hypothetical protein KIH27_04555 [Mycobacterium sp. M1]|uniref:Uncharacterized protein n=1 Tax=Mycolicibacter acidiphilus TaxID=2835306 RepID=A0ABS5RFS7_9MYCO|nr:hypothetical protein [Mycolicibacter acidiphilus]MBS9532857.1 hypothetical protein [Mycolicibacter acidiphilus]
MNAKRVMGASAIAVGVGLSGLFGAGIGAANAAPAEFQPGMSVFSQSGPDIRLDHHDRKKALKQEKHDLKHNRQDLSTVGHRW